MATLQFSAQIEEVKRNKDKTLRLKVDTQELPANESALLLELQDKQIWIALAETEITHNDIHIPEEIEEFDTKTPSERLHDRMFVYWKEKKIGGDFKIWRIGQLDKIGQSYLDKIK